MAVYNVLPYLERAVTGVLAQTFRDFELILVDDGSTDGSGDMCDELSKGDDRIRVIHQENQGLSRTWAVGVENAKCEYIGFSDSDDFILPCMYERMLSVLNDNKTDIVRCGLFKIPVNNAPPTLPLDEKDYLDIWQEGWEKKDLSDTVFDAQSFIHDFFDNHRPHSLVLTVFHRDLVKTVFFDKRQRRAADFSFWLNFFEATPEFTVSTIPDCMYIYLKRAGSVTGNPALWESWLRVHNRELRFCAANNLQKGYNSAFSLMTHYCLVGAIDLSRKGPISKETRKETLMLLRKGLRNYCKANKKLYMYKLGLIMLCASPKIYYGVYSAFRLLRRDRVMLDA